MIGRGTGAAAAALAAIVWASAAGAAPGKLCSVTRAWVERHCDKAGRLATPERCTKWRGWLGDRCPADMPSVSDTGTNRSKVGEERPDRSKAAELDKRVDRNKAGDGRATRGETAVSGVSDQRSKAAVADANPYRRKVKDIRDHDAAKYNLSRHRKHTHKIRTRVVYVYVERPPRRCCYSEPVLYYRTTPYRDQVFFTDYVLRPGNEAAFFRAQEDGRQ